ncbi:MAG TPA: 23S rRNA (uracil(1939)-C(5))-methyltransferase RlmD [Syntrophorhabdaceae bacterium]
MTKSLKREEKVLEIVDVSLPDGFGVGKEEGFVYFVPGAVAGDIVRIGIRKRDRRFSVGDILEIIRPSSHRAQPFCGHFGSCGGCTLQHIAYDRQLEIKENHLRQALARIGGVDLESVEIAPIVPAPHQQWGRNNIELSFGRGKSGLVLGLRERAAPGKSYEGKVVPLSQCPAFSTAIDSIVPVVSEYFNRSGLTPYDPGRKKGILKHLLLRESKSTGRIMAVLETAPGPIISLSALWHELRERVPRLGCFYRAVSKGSVDTGLYDYEEHLFGAASIEESVAGLTFHIYPQSFFQANTAVAELLYESVLEVARLGKGDKVLGLYSGMGPLEIILSRNARRVTGVDSNPANIINARLNCQVNDIMNCVFIEGKVEQLKSRLPSGPDLLVIDPPRGGVSPQGLSLAVSLNPSKFIYISCNPSTLARDIGLLRGSGYRPVKILPFDAFPHTSHLETLVLLETGGPF